MTDKTLRLIVRTSIGGDRVRIRLSNEYSTKPLVIGAAHIANLLGHFEFTGKPEPVETYRDFMTMFDDMTMSSKVIAVSGELVVTGNEVRGAVPGSGAPATLSSVTVTLVRIFSSACSAWKALAPSSAASRTT